jgi:small subunit ribosomal protein S20
VRQNEKRRLRNQRRKKTIRTLMKQMNTHLAAGEKDQASALMPEFTKAVDKAAQRNVVHQNKAARLKSRVAQRLAAA